MEGPISRDNDIIDVSDKFSSGLDLGITDTLTMGSSDLLKFLTDDVPTDAEPIKEEKPDVKPTSTTVTETTTVVEDKPDAKKDLESFLFGEYDDKPSAPDDNKDKQDDEPADDEPVVNTFEVIAKELFEAGILTKDEDEEEDPITSGDSLLERFEQEKHKGAIDIVDKFLSKFGEDYRDMFDAVFVKGVDPKEYLKSYDTIQSFKDLDLSVEANQKKVFVEYLKQQGFSEEKIEQRLQKAIDYMDLEEDAKLYHEKLVEKEEARIQKLTEDQEQKRQLQYKQDQEYNQNLQRILQEKLKEKEFDGIPVTPKLAQETYSFLYHKKYKTPSGEELTEFDKFISIDLKKPENHELRVKLGLLALNKFDLSKVKTTQESKDKKKIFDGLDKTVINRKVQAAKQNPQTRSFFD